MVQFKNLKTHKHVALERNGIFCGSFVQGASYTNLEKYIELKNNTQRRPSAIFNMAPTVYR